MVRNNSPDGKRYHMTAFVSDDDGAKWKGGLLLDERESSYPDGIQAEDGTLFIIYDHQRYTLNRAGKRGVGSVVMATFREADIRAAFLDLIEMEHMLVEGSAAMAYAACRQHASQVDGATAVLLCGGNVGVDKLRTILA